jgi:energy-coupling factor transporter ATP-binding protein EcfA2
VRTETDISRVRAEGVLDEFNYDIEFGGPTDEGRLRVIYAPNGRGKTNLLRAINLAMNSSLDALQAQVEVPIRRLRIEFTTGGSIEVTRESAFSSSFRITASDGDTDDEHSEALDVSPSDFAGRLFRRAWTERPEYVRFVTLLDDISFESVLIGDDRLVAVPDEDRDSVRSSSQAAAIRRRSSNNVSRLLETVERMLTQSAFASISREGASAGVYAEITKTTLKGAKTLPTAQARSALQTQIRKILRAGVGHEKYGLLSLRQVKDVRTQIAGARSNAANFPTLHRILKPYLDSLEVQIESLAPAQQLIDTYVSAVNNFLDRKELRFSATRGIELYGRGGAVLQPDSLSSGEKHLLVLLSHAMLATAERQLVIIDEPELSLGIDWQRDLLEELLRCSASSKVQFLVASHSVQVMGNLAPTDIIRPTEQ